MSISMSMHMSMTMSIHISMPMPMSMSILIGICSSSASEPPRHLYTSLPSSILLPFSIHPSIHPSIRQSATSDPVHPLSAISVRTGSPSAIHQSIHQPPISPSIGHPSAIITAMLLVLLKLARLVSSRLIISSRLGSTMSRLGSLSSTAPCAPRSPTPSSTSTQSSGCGRRACGGVICGGRSVQQEAPLSARFKSQGDRPVIGSLSIIFGRPQILPSCPLFTVAYVINLFTPKSRCRGAEVGDVVKRVCGVLTMRVRGVEIAD